MSQDPSSSTQVSTAFVSLDGDQLYTKTWTPSIPPVAYLFFIHGFSEHIDRYDHVFGQFGERGIKTFAFDQRGFGRSAPDKKQWGKTGGVAKALQDIDYFVKKFKEEAQKNNLPLFLLGHSMGGALALMYAGKQTDKDLFRGVLSQSTFIKLCDPPSKVTMFFLSLVYKLIPNVKIHNPILGTYISRDPELAKRYDEDPLIHGTGTVLAVYTMITEFEGLLAHPPHIIYPLLVQAGTSDKLTSFQAAKEVYDKMPPGHPDREFKAWEGYYHELHNEPLDERNASIAYLENWILARCKDSGEPRAKL